MGCATSSQQKASSPECSASLPERVHSTVSKLSRTVSRKLSRKLSCHSSRSLGKQEKPDEPLVADAAPEPEASQVKFVSGPPLTLLEARFDPKSSRCTLCGNTGLDIEGRFCKCPYGRRNPPARLSEGDVEVDVGPLSIGSDGQALLPRMKLGIRGPYIYEVGGRRSAAIAKASHTYMACAAMGPTWSHILEQVHFKTSCPSAKVLLEAMPEILAAVQRSTSVNIPEECAKARKTTRGEDHLNTNGIVYVFSSSVSAEQFLGSLDIAGYSSTVCKGDGLQELGLEMRVSISHDRRIVRVSVYQASSGTGFDGIIKLRIQIPEHVESEDKGI